MANKAHQQALKELQEEEFKGQVQIEKEKILKKKNRNLWERVFPWKITITRR